MSRHTQQEIATPIIATPANEPDTPQCDHCPCATTVAASAAPPAAPTVPKPKRVTLTLTRRLTYCATLVATALIFKLLGNYFTFGGFKLSPVYIPWMLAGILMGPFGGALVGFATDVLGMFLMPTGGSILPLTVLSNTLFPLFVGLAYRYIPRLGPREKIFIGAAVSLLACTLGLGTYSLADFYGMPYFSYLVLRLPQIIVVGVNTVLTVLLLPALKKLKLVETT